MDALDHLVWCGFVLLAMSVVMGWYKLYRWFMELAKPLHATPASLL